MSQIASAYTLVADDLADLAAVATPRRRFLRSAVDTYPEVLAAKATPLAGFDGDAMCVLTAMIWLQDHGADLLESEHDEFATVLTDARQVTTIVLDASHQQLTGQLEGALASDTDFATLHAELGGESGPEANAGVRAGLRYLIDLLGGLRDGHIVLLQLG